MVDFDINVLFEKVKNGNPLTVYEENYLNEHIDNLNKEIFRLQNELLTHGRVKEYSDLLFNGFSKEEVNKFIDEDDETIKNAEIKLEQHRTLNRSMMFGYPANMSKDSNIISYLRFLESKMYLMNSCGDAYHPGNYRMNNAKTELKIIEKVIKNLKLDPKKYWGYINSGGTEGNFWGLREGVTQYPNSVIYCSKASHYSVSKFLDMFGRFNTKTIDEIYGKIDRKQLIASVIRNFNEKRQAAVILLTLGTTALGSVDDIEEIKKDLIKYNIPHYIHLDAAMYGGIPNNQLKSPVYKFFDKLNDLDIDSISISLHKYIGNHKVNGILLAQNQSVDNFIDYIGQRDISVLGSRDIAPFSTLQRVKELYERTEPNEYYKNVEFFENLLIENDIKYFKGHKYGNTFVIDQPSEEVCKEFQLATFKHNGKDSAHIIIFPYHTKESMSKLIKAIKN